MTDILTALIVLIIVITIAAIVFFVIWKKGNIPKKDDESSNLNSGNQIQQKKQDFATKPWLKIESAFTPSDIEEIEETLIFSL